MWRASELLFLEYPQQPLKSRGHNPQGQTKNSFIGPLEADELSKELAAALTSASQESLPTNSRAWRMLYQKEAHPEALALNNVKLTLGQIIKV